MNIHYEVKTLKNSRGEGKDNTFVTLEQQQCMTAEQMEAQIESACSLTKADVRGVMAAVRELAAQQLTQGSRLYLPGLGWLSLSVGLNRESRRDGHRITGKDVIVRGIRFRPEAKLLNEIKENVSFTSSALSSNLKEYTEDELWDKLATYLGEHSYITRRDMRQKFGLSKYKAQQWLDRYAVAGKAVMHGWRELLLLSHSPLWRVQSIA